MSHEGRFSRFQGAAGTVLRSHLAAGGAAGTTVLPVPFFRPEAPLKPSADPLQSTFSQETIDE